MNAWVFSFHEIDDPNPLLYGGKGANLAVMTKQKLRVPPGFVLTTRACHATRQNKGQLSPELWDEVVEHIASLERETGKRFGERQNPLLVSVRSGAPMSMPGMMDTVLNLGLNDDTVRGVAAKTGDLRFAYDCYRRFIQMFGEVVLGIGAHQFEQIRSDGISHGDADHRDFTHPDRLRLIIDKYLTLVANETGRPFPQSPLEQLHLAICAVFGSWDNQRAVVYRKVHHIDENLGTAVTVQSMVFGNMGDDSGTGVAFTRNPSTGDPGVFGEYLVNAQGEDVVAGTRTPQPISELAGILPHVHEELLTVCRRLEEHYEDVQDIEFTVQQGELYLLQTRTAKRTTGAAVKIAVNLVQEGVISRTTAVSRIQPEQLDQILHPTIDDSIPLSVMATGLPASPGAACGRIAFTADDAVKMAKEGERVLLVRSETTPEDIHGILAADGILTSRGGMTSHAAVVARGMGKPCVCGCAGLFIQEDLGTCVIGDTVLCAGEELSIDGGTGRVIRGEVPVRDSKLSPEMMVLLDWADELRSLAVRANADNPDDALKAREFGAQGVGLCRTEHMFMAKERIPLVQDMILARDETDRQKALDRLLPLQQGDFYGILKAMDGYPVTIRLLDPPLHEFLPSMEHLVARQAALSAAKTYEPNRPAKDAELAQVDAMLAKVRALTESNPMLGHRGCRLAITYPEIYEMQVKAIFEATADLIEEGFHPRPEVMIPLVGHVEELRRMRSLVERVATDVKRSRAVEFPLSFGTMIEVPRAALTADKIATEAEFFSFGTNDLTQTTFGFSRDDAEGKFLSTYVNDRILPDNPFAVLDVEGVGELISIAANKGKSVKPNLKLGLCGEHGGEQASIAFCHKNHLNYVSCSPFRVPLARLAAAQAAIDEISS